MLKQICVVALESAFYTAQQEFPCLLQEYLSVYKDR